MPGPTAPSQPIAGGPTDGATVNGTGVLDFYRTMAAAAARVARQYRLAFWSELALIALYFAMRSFGYDDRQMVVWLAAVIVVAFASPATALVVLAAVAPFNDGLDIRFGVGSKTVIAVAIVGGIAFRWLAVPSARAKVSPPVVLAGLLIVATGLGLIRTYLRWGSSFAADAAGTWAQGIVTMLLVFIATAWIARLGDRRTLLVAVAATTVAAILSLVDFWGDAVLRDTALGWALTGAFNADRLTGVIRSPTSTAALVMLPLTVALAAVLVANDPRWRIAAAAASVPLLAAAYLTYNRGVFIALYAFAVVVGWRIGRRLGVGLLAVGLVAGALLVPWYVSIRGQALGAASTLQPGEVLIASDQQRLGAWAAAGRMFLDQPLVGQGYRAYRQLSIEYGDPTLNAPHNEWLRLFAEHGAVVGILGIAFALATARRLAHAPGWLGAGLFASFASLSVAASFNNVFLFNQVTIPAMVLAGTGVALSGRTRIAVREGV